MHKLIVCDPEKCLGCRICEFACSAKTAKSTNLLLSRIRVVDFEPRGSLALACMLCEDPPCVRSCPKDALRQSEKTGQIIVDEEKCTGCSWCEIACPFGTIASDPTKKVVTICDLCEGEPECVKACPYEALAFTTPEEVMHKSRREAFTKLLKDLGEA